MGDSEREGAEAIVPMKGRPQLNAGPGASPLRSPGHQNRAWEAGVGLRAAGGGTQGAANLLASYRRTLLARLKG